jgi:membrane protease YdiL (CAAX protease family)
VSSSGSSLRGGAPSGTSRPGCTCAGEELFWRGLFLGELERSVGGLAAVVLAWGGFVLANLPSGNLAIVAGAVVGGAVWVALAWWTGGIAASLCCHAAWTALMLALPPAVAEEGAA